MKILLKILRSLTVRSFADPAVLFLVIVSTMAAAEKAAASASAVAQLNLYRTQAGLQPLSASDTLYTAAQAHADYLRLNNAFSHSETPGFPGYYGTTLADRAERAGYSWSCLGEAISAGNKEPADGIDSLIAAIYHRFILLNPTYLDVGVGFAVHPSYDTVEVVDVGRRAGVRGPTGLAAVYPADGQENVPTAFNSDSEYPDPVPGRSWVGYPASIHFSEEHLEQLAEMRLYHNNRSVGATVLSAETDPYISHGYAVIADNPLERNAYYDVLFAGTVNGRAFRRTWSFSTGVMPQLAAVSADFDSDGYKEFAVARRKSDQTVEITFYDDDMTVLGRGFVGRVRELDMAAGDFAGDAKAEVVVAVVQDDGTLATIVLDSTGRRLSKAVGGRCSSVSVSAGRFDADSLDEYAVGMIQADGTLAVIVFDGSGARLGKAVGGAARQPRMAAGNFDTNPSDDEIVAAMLQQDGTLAAITFQTDGRRIGKATGGPCTRVDVAAGNFLGSNDPMEEYVLSFIQWDGTAAALTCFADGSRIAKGVSGPAAHVHVASGRFAATAPLHGYVLSMRQSDGRAALIFYDGEGHRLGKGLSDSSAFVNAVASGDITGNGLDEGILVFVTYTGQTRWAVFDASGMRYDAGP